jgi:D-galactose 1-dehydrogenase
MPVKVALVGIGKIARDQHIPTIAESPDWELAATVSRHGGIDGVECFDDLAAMLDARTDVEVVSLCTPPLARFAAAAMALGAGRHVMLEKPPGATVAECLRLKTMAEAAGVSIFATWHSREAAQVARARRWLANKRLRRLHVTWKEDVRRWHPGQHWIWQPGGLGVFDPGINALSVVTAILAEPIHLTSATLSVPANCQTPIAATLAFAHPRGAEITAEFDFRQQGKQMWTITLETDEGTALLADGGARMAIDGIEQAPPAGHADALVGEYPRLYARMAQLLRSRGIDMDISPLIHVADAFLLGSHVTVEPFIE